MSTQVRRESSSVIEGLQANVNEFPFYQAVRLLERAEMLRDPKAQPSTVAKFVLPNSEFVRFASQITLGFPNSEIAKLSSEATPEGKYRWRLLVNFLCLAGSTGVLPYHYTELIFNRLKLKDESLRDFLDIFHHRTTSLFYQAGLKYRLPIAYERQKLYQNRYHRHDSATNALLSLVGLGTAGITDQLLINEEALLFFAGFLSQRVRPASSLRQMLSYYFDVPIIVEEFVGQWHDLIDDVRSRLPYPGFPQGQNSRLGRSAILGNKGWFAQGKMRIVVGPLNAEQFQRFAPGTRALAKLNDMVKLFAGAETECEYILRISRKFLPSRIQLNQSKPPILGWDTWLANAQASKNHEEMLDIRVTSSLMK